jgi:hypothetical protein
MRLSEITHADMRRIRLRSEAALPYQGIPAKPAQPACQTRTGIVDRGRELSHFRGQD